MKKRLLFVDDEPGMLDLFRLMFKGMNEQWEMFFATSGPDALALLEKMPFEVIITDMRMPGMNGAQLLSEVMHRYPRTARIILSGYAEQEAVAKCVGAAHQYLIKPSDLATLKSTLSRVCALDLFLSNETLKALVSKMGVLPSLPSLYFRILQELQSPFASIERIGEIVTMDPAMTAKMLQLVNSAFFGVSRKIANAAEAVSLLGVGTVRSLAISLHAFSCFDQSKLNEFSFERIWDHSMTTGVLAKKITQLRNVERTMADESFIAGLLHDIGKLMMISNLPDQYRQALTLARQKPLTISEAEREVFGATHADVGAYLLGLWGLPVPIVEAVALHHTPSKNISRHFSPLTAVHVADVLEHERSGSPNSISSPHLDADYLAEANLQNEVTHWREIFEEMSAQNTQEAA